jgi:hypothetical protein
MPQKQSNNQPIPPVNREKPVKDSELREIVADNRQEVKVKNPEPVRSDKAKTGEPKLIIKNGATDCRRSEKALSKVIDERMHMNSHSGDMYGFANSTQTIAKVIRFDKTGGTLYKKHSDTPFEWPPYDGKASILKGSQAEQFLADIGLPKEILKNKESPEQAPGY